MPMTKAANQHEIGDKLYFFQSTQPKEGNVLIFAHGGHLWQDAPDFAVKAGVTVSFLQPEDGKALQTNPWAAMFHDGKPKDKDVESFVGPTRVKEYSLGKGVGSHWKKETTIDYTTIAKKMQAQVDLKSSWTPHIVTVRRRFRGLGRLITLSKAIEGIRDFAAKNNLPITRIYVGACRGDASTKRFISTLARI